MKELLMNAFAVYVLLGSTYYFFKMIQIHLKNVINFKKNPSKAERTVNVFNSLDIGFTIFVLSGAILDYSLKSKFGDVLPNNYTLVITILTVVLIVLTVMSLTTSNGNIVSKRYLFIEMGIIVCITNILLAAPILFLLLSYKA